MKSFNASTIPFDHFGPRGYYYPVTGMPTSAFMVTDENIGALSVDFGVEIFYSDERPAYCMVKLDRFDEEGNNTPTRKPVRVGDWVVFLRGEIRIFSDAHFRATFAEMVQRTNEPRHENWMDAELEDRNTRDPAPSPHPRSKPALDIDKLIREAWPVAVEDHGSLVTGVVRDVRIDAGIVVGNELYVEFDAGGGNWFHEANVHLAPAQPAIPGNSFTFKKDDRVSLENDTQGTVIEGPNEHGNYYVHRDNGGLGWYPPEDLRLVLVEKQEKEQL